MLKQEEETHFRIPSLGGPEWISIAQIHFLTMGVGRALWSNRSVQVLLHRSSQKASVWPQPCPRTQQCQTQHSLVLDPKLQSDVKTPPTGETVENLPCPLPWSSCSVWQGSNLHVHHSQLHRLWALTPSDNTRAISIDLKKPPKAAWQLQHAQLPQYLTEHLRVSWWISALRGSSI